MIEGYGRMTFIDDNSVYEGDWFNGERHGYGTYNDGRGTCYAGEFFEGTMQGFGKITFADNTVYEGIKNSYLLLLLLFIIIIIII